MSITFKNIDLSNVSTVEQYNKLEEEIMEFNEALILGEKEEVMDELLDVFQVLLGLAHKEQDIKAEEVMEYYPIWVKKLEKRPR